MSADRELGHLGMPDMGAFSPDPLGRVKLYKGGGGGGTTVSTGTTYTSNIPEWMKADTLNLIDRARGESLRPYEGYEGDKVAGFSDLQTTAQGNLADMGEPTELGIASDKIGELYGNVPSSYDALQYEPGKWTADGVSQEYMSPYMQNVVDIQKREAIRQGDQLQNKIGFEADAAGAFGGDRHAIRESEADRNLMQQLNDIQATGSQEAYGQGMQQYNADRTAQSGAIGMEEASRQYGAGYAQSAAKAELSIAQAQAQVGEARQTLELARENARNAVGAEQQAQAQRELDAAIKEFTNARDYERQNIAFMSSILRGTNVPVSQESNSYLPASNGMNTALGLGLAGLGALRKE